MKLIRASRLRYSFNLSLLFIVFTSFPSFAQSTPDLILHNAKIITVDQQFRIVQALAITGDRITATGTNASILKLKGKSTEVVDLKGKTVIPGLIDNHAHFIRAPEHMELRLDGVLYRKEAVQLIKQAVAKQVLGKFQELLKVLVALLLSLENYPYQPLKNGKIMSNPMQAT